VYEPTCFPLPLEVSIENAHGIVIDPLDNNTTIIITYQDTKNDFQCLLRWNINQYQTVGELIGPGSSLCQGIPHGLRGEIEYDTMMQRNRTVLYHANNQQVLHKTTWRVKFYGQYKVLQHHIIVKVGMIRLCIVPPGLRKHRNPYHHMFISSMYMVPIIFMFIIVIMERIPVIFLVTLE
jgi:hypothetical protein